MKTETARKLRFRITQGRVGALSPTTRKTFSPFPAMLQKYEAKGFDGGGIGAFNGFGAVDIDNCIDADGFPNELAMNIMGTMASYTERSPSGRGIRIIFKAPGFVYDTKRYYINNQKAWA